MSVRAAVCALVVTLVCAPVAAQTPPPEPDLRVFVGRGCPHCGRALLWLDELRSRRPELTVEVFDVVDDPVALEALAELSRSRGLAGVTVPTFVIRGADVRVGFDEPETTGVMLEELLGRSESGADPPPASAPDASQKRSSEANSTSVSSLNLAASNDPSWS